MKIRYILVMAVLLLVKLPLFAQTARAVHGTVIDSTKATLPGSIVKLVTATDSITTATDVKGAFVFPAVKATQFSLVIQSIGYQPIRRRINLDNSKEPVFLRPIILKTSTTMLGVVNITDVVPVRIKEDTVEFNTAAYKVRDGAMIEDVIKKLPGADVDKDGNVTFQGKSVTKVRVNGKDFFGGDLRTATQNLPADAVTSVQMVNDYGDQANLTGIKSGEPQTVLNINIKASRNHGYFGQISAGEGADAIPQVDGSKDQNRYLIQGNAFSFDNSRQLALIGNVNNTNTTLFNFGPPGSNVNTSNGITTARSIGFNYRDSWGKKITVYGSYSFSDNSVYSVSSTIQDNISLSDPSVFTQSNIETDRKKNHRLTFNMEYRIDTVNYLKISPYFTYAGLNSNQSALNKLASDTGVISGYTLNSISHSSAPSYGINALYNHRFNSHGRNFSINAGVGTSSSDAYQNPVYLYTAGKHTAPADQMITTNSRTDTAGTQLSYIEPLAKKSYLEFNYAYHHGYTTANKLTDTLTGGSQFNEDPLLSNDFSSTFITNKFGINYRFIEKKYNYVLGVTAEPSLLEGKSPVIAPTSTSIFNISPNAHFIYNFSRSQSLSFNFSGNSNSPGYAQLQPVTDFSNASFPVTGNPYLKPEYSNTFSLRYNKFDFQTGNVLFSNFSFVQTDNKVVPITVYYPANYTSPGNLAGKLAGTIETQYQNTAGYYSASGFYIFEKPWQKRRYRLFLIGNVSYTNNISYIRNIDSTSFAATTEKNIAKTLVLSQGLRFRVDITDVVDVEPNTTYSVNSSRNSILQPGIQDNFRTWVVGVTGKNYVFKNYTFSYDYTKTYYYNYAGSKNPNLLNTYVEYRFLKTKTATVRASVFDIFNQNTGYSSTINGSTITQSNFNRLGRYYLFTLAYRFQKTAGQAPRMGPGGGGPPPGGGMGGPPPGGGPGGPGGD